MNNTMPIVQPDPRNKTRRFWKPDLPEAQEARPVPAPKGPPTIPYLLAPHPWPRGQFRMDPEA
jgi:hypothetical protein